MSWNEASIAVISIKSGSVVVFVLVTCVYGSTSRNAHLLQHLFATCLPGYEECITLLKKVITKFAKPDLKQFCTPIADDTLCILLRASHSFPIYGTFDESERHWYDYGQSPDTQQTTPRPKLDPLLSAQAIYSCMQCAMSSQASRSSCPVKTHRSDTESTDPKNVAASM